MKDILRLILRGLWVIVEYKDTEGRGQYRFNLKNPLGYILLLITAIVVGIVEGFTSFYRVIDETLTDAVRDRRSNGVYKMTDTGGEGKPWVMEREQNSDIRVEIKEPIVVEPRKPPVNGNQLYEDAMRGRDVWPE